MTLKHFVKKQTPILRHVNIHQEINPGLDLGKDRQLFEVRKKRFSQFTTINLSGNLYCHVPGSNTRRNP